MQYVLAADGEGVNDKDETWSQMWWNYVSNCTSLHHAAALNQVGLCKLILDHPHFHEANSVASLVVDSLGFRNGWTALHVACAEGSREVVALLLQHPKFIAIQKQDSRNEQILLVPFKANLRTLSLSACSVGLNLLGKI